MREAADRCFPDRQILIRGPGNVVLWTVSQRQQILVVGGLAAVMLWAAGASLGMAMTLARTNATAATERSLQAQLGRATREIAELRTEKEAMATSRDVAIATADRARDMALAQANQAVSDALVRANRATQLSAAQIGALTQQTQDAIARVESIIRATGLDPDGLARAAGDAKSWHDGAGQNHAALLENDVGKLGELTDVLEKLPLTSPVDDISISSGYGFRADPFTGLREFHVGIDLRGPIGTPVYATAPGIVSFAGAQTGYGELIEVDHGLGLSTRYSHLDKILVHAGDKVTLHEIVGLMGNTGWSTGPHLLYETRENGQTLNPLNFIEVSQNDVQQN
jgi:murein DD-endopeptidase MepM/ murein hydrolase activator NlpD